MYKCIKITQCLFHRSIFLYQNCTATYLFYYFREKQYLIDMASSAEKVTEKFLRTYCQLFTARDMGKYLSQMGIRASSRETEDFLETHPLVFPLEKDFYITRAGAFTDELFSIKPTAREFAQDVFVAGDRCIPFVDSEMISSSLDFYIDGVKLPKKVVQFDSDDAIDMFVLYGEEYAPQYIAADPANESLDLVDSEFALPNTVSLTGVDISLLKQKYGFSKNDRLLCHVTDWDAGKIEIQILHETAGDDLFDKGAGGENRLHWYNMLEQFMLTAFDRLGPCSTIEEQLADVFFEHRVELCVQDCGSIEEYIHNHAKKVGLEFFGVETRLWRKDEDVPAVGKWNSVQLDMAGKSMEQCSGDEHIFYTMPDFVFDQYILDMLYRKSDDQQALLARVFPEEFKLSKAELKYVMLHLTERSGILRASYNWFADQTAGPVRQRALELYSKVALLVYKIDCTGNTLEKFPQQELVILSQLYSHITRILESVANNDHIEEDSEAILLSLDGMEMNFEDIEGELEYAVSQQEKNRFTVVK